MQTPPLIMSREDLRGKRILLRLDLNVPLEHGEVRDAYRIEQSLHTVNWLRREGARIVIISHIGKGTPEDTLKPIADHLNALFPTIFLSDLMSPENARVTEGMQDGEVVLVENLRHNKGEEENDPAFAAYLASLGDIYVNDAFSVSHRAHASVVGVPALLPHYAGFLMDAEVRRLSMVFTPEHPFVFILGGSKISTKMPLLKKFLSLADHVILGGAIVNNFFKVAGHEIGDSVYDKDQTEGLEPYLHNERLILPSDVVVKNAAGSEIRRVGDVHAGDMIVDVGPASIKDLQSVIGGAKLIVWNGPLGYYEEGFTEGTRELLSLVAGSSATSIIGGGDTVALIRDMGALEQFSFVSTGGGAMLDYLSSETLPGIEALTRA